MTLGEPRRLTLHPAGRNRRILGKPPNIQNLGAVRASMHRHARRPAGDRPAESDHGLCPFCRAGVLQYRKGRPDTKRGASAWVCDNPACGYRLLTDDLIRASKERQAMARRAAMKARARAERSQQRIAQNDTRVRRKNG